MKKLKILKILVGLTKMTLTDKQNKISTDGRVLRSFGGKIGLTQGDQLSTVLFSIALEAVFRDGEMRKQRII
jgi:hypothetical protein